MALLPNTKIYGTTGNNSSPTEKVGGGVVVGITSATTVTNGSPLTQTFPITQNSIAVNADAGFVVSATGDGHAYNAQIINNAGTFNYKQSQFMIRGVANKINNITNLSIFNNGNEGNIVRRAITLQQKGAKTVSAMVAGYWNPLGISGQRTNWSTAPVSASGTYFLPTDNTTAADDQAIFVTYRTVPGELVYMYGAIDPLQDEYKAITG